MQCHAMLRGQSPCPQPLVAGSHRCVCLGHMTSRTKCSGQGEVAASESQGQGSQGDGVCGALECALSPLWLCFDKNNTKDLFL